MKIFLTSDIGASKVVDVNGKKERVAKEISNNNFFLDNLKSKIEDQDNFIFIASNPNSYEITDSFAYNTFKSFSLSGILFKKLIILDDRNFLEWKSIIENADVIFLAGGDTLTQMKMFNTNNLTEILKNFEGVIIGQSAGSINLADEAYCSPENEDELKNERYWKGLGLTNINIEPHYDREVEFKDRFHEKILIEDSMIKPFIAIPDGSYIYDDGLNQILYGEGYLYNNGNCIQISKNNEILNLKKACKNENEL